MNKQYWLYKDLNYGSIHFSPTKIDGRDDLEYLNHVIEYPAYHALQMEVNRLKNCDFDKQEALFEARKHKAKLDIVRRYHGGDGSITRETLMETIGDCEGTTK